jgi:hypothetical protein
MQNVCTGIVVPSADCKSDTQDKCLPAIKACFMADLKLGWSPEVKNCNFLARSDAIFKGQNPMMFQETKIPSSPEYFMVMDIDIFSLLYQGMIPPS